MSWFTIDLQCDRCGVVSVVVIDKADREKEHECPIPECGGTGYAVMGSPTVLKASFPDGHKRKGWSDLKTTVKLEREMAHMPSEKRAELKREVRKINRMAKYENN